MKTTCFLFLILLLKEMKIKTKENAHKQIAEIFSGKISFHTDQPFWWLLCQTEVCVVGDGDNNSNKKNCQKA